MGQTKNQILTNEEIHKIEIQHLKEVTDLLKKLSSEEKEKIINYQGGVTLSDKDFIEKVLYLLELYGGGTPENIQILNNTISAFSEPLQARQENPLDGQKEHYAPY